LYRRQELSLNVLNICRVGEESETCFMSQNHFDSDLLFTVLSELGPMLSYEVFVLNEALINQHSENQHFELLARRVY
jgi:hypothetical protein